MAAYGTAAPNCLHSGKLDNKRHYTPSSQPSHRSFAAFDATAAPSRDREYPKTLDLCRMRHSERRISGRVFVEPDG